MKTIIAIFFAIGMLLASLVTDAQSKSDKMYNAFNNKEGVTNFSFSKNMVDAVDINLDDEFENNVIGDLYQVRFMSYNPKKGDISGTDFTKKAIGYLPKSAYKKYEDEGENDSEIWLLGRNKKFKECHIFTKSEHDDQLRFVVSFYGDFKVNDLDILKNTGESISANEE